MQEKKRYTYDEDLDGKGARVRLVGYHMHFIINPGYAKGESGDGEGESFFHSAVVVRIHMSL
jgi:hypothetical protein